MRRASTGTVALATLVALLLAVGCGQTTAGPGGGPEPVDSSEGAPQQPESPPGPPDVVLASAGGRQVGVVGSYCVHKPGANVGACADGTRPAAKRANVVRPGETVTIELDGARAVRARDCHSRDFSCIGEAQVSPTGCGERTIARIHLERGSQTEWRVDLEPGAYELQLFVYFEADDGLQGDVSVALGLVVDPEAEPDVVPMPAVAAVCR
jgi:hypothetical protein